MTFGDRRVPLQRNTPLRQGPWRRKSRDPGLTDEGVADGNVEKASSTGTPDDTAPQNSPSSSGGRSSFLPRESRPRPSPPKRRSTPQAGSRSPSPDPVPPELRQFVIDRAGGLCDLCRKPCTGWPGYSLQHRDARGMGGTSLDPHTPENLVLLCGSATTGCHGYVEQTGEGRRWAYDHGFAIRGTVVTPETMPIFRHGREWVFPTGDGWVPAVPDGDGGWKPARIAC